MASAPSAATAGSLPGVGTIVEESRTGTRHRVVEATPAAVTVIPEEGARRMSFATDGFAAMFDVRSGN